MDDNAEQTSGNRWEPTPDATPTETTPTQTTAAAPPSRPTWVTRARAAVAGGAAAVLLVGGLGGFALGRATAGSEDTGVTQRQGVPGGFDPDGDGEGPGLQGGPGGGPMMGQAPDGQADSSGTDSSDT